MKETMKWGIKLLLIILFIVIFISLIFKSLNYLSEQTGKELDIACKKIGFIESKEREFCQDSEGYYHKVEFDCHWFFGNNCIAKEMKFKIKSLGG